MLEGVASPGGARAEGFATHASEALLVIAAKKGAIGGAAYGTRYFRDTDVQSQFGDAQERLNNLMSEVRSILDESRVEWRQARAQLAQSAEEKATRLQRAVTSEPSGSETTPATSSNATPPSS